MLRIFKQYYPIRNVIFVIGEGLFIFSSVLIASWIIIGTDIFVQDPAIFLKTFLIALVSQACLYYNSLYDVRVIDNYRTLITRLFQSLGVAAIFLSIVYFLFPVCIIEEGVFVVSTCFSIVFIILWRIVYAYILNHGIFNEKIIILGNGLLAQNIAKEIHEHIDCGYTVSEVIPAIGSGHNSAGAPCEDAYSGLDGYVKELGIDKIIVAIEERRTGFPIRQLLQCRVHGIDIIEGTSFYEMLTGKLIVEQINPSWLIFSDGFRKSRTRKIVKRISDIALSSLMLMALSPILGLVMILIKLDSKGPVFFSQERVGENKKPYIVYKFRSMINDAEAKTGPVWAETGDQRVTRVGRFIRKWRIDEFPQLFNVIKGEMSFVGPRPERAFFVEVLETKIPYYSERFSVKPGVTGWAQVSYSYGASDEDAKEKLNYDLFYIKNMTLLMDIMVIMRTVKTVLLGEGAR